MSLRLTMTLVETVGAVPAGSSTRVPVSGPVDAGAGGGPLGANVGLIVGGNGAVAGLRGAKNAPLDRQYAPRRKTPPSAPVEVGEIPHQPLHPNPKVHSPIQGERGGERAQTAR